MYVTLEPCCHHGRTPPCTKAIIGAGVREVHLALLDPNPLVSGRGKQELEKAGIRVYVGEGQAEAAEINEAFIKHITSGLPFVTAKFAMSLDGKIATRTGDSKWITGEEARQRVHQLRDVVDAILVGVNTVLADDPLLTVRLDTVDPERGPHYPLRVIADSRGRTPPTARVFRGQGRTLVATTEPVQPEWARAIAGVRGEVLPLPAKEGRVDLAALLKALSERGVTSLLVEGGGTLLASFLSEGSVDKVLAFIAPVIIGGPEAPTPVRGPGAETVAQALRLKRPRVETLGEDVLVTGYVSPPAFEKLAVVASQVGEGV
jgi:diaminohydroxyphosphoribosylaminopyrimidine deaminase/5-amino-6-(5-phosphoribosylamino)uracil reductase